MRLIVTGAAGFIGAHVVRAALGRNDKVLAVLRSGTASTRLTAFAGQIETAAPDLHNRDEVTRAIARFQPDALVHLAWYARPGDYLHSPENLTSLQASLRLLEAALAAGCRRIVGVGTCLEYAESAEPREESDPTDPRSLYASCKLASWLIGRARARQQGADLVWARLFHVYGPGEHPARLIPSAAATLRAGRAFGASPGLQVRDPIHVADVATALLSLADRGEAGPYNVCLGRPASLRHTLETVAAIAGGTELLQFGVRGYAPDEDMFLVGNPMRLRALGWQPRFEDLRAGLEDALSAPSVLAD